MIRVRLFGFEVPTPSVLQTAGNFKSTALVVRFVSDTGASTAIEYSIVAVSIGAAVATAVWSLGTALQTTFYARLAELF